MTMELINIYDAIRAVDRHMLEEVTPVMIPQKASSSCSHDKRTGTHACDLPSAQPERKRGYWEFYEDRSPVWDIAGEKTWARAYKCSVCGFVHSVIEDFGQYAFCPNCGADMREI